MSGGVLTVGVDFIGDGFVNADLVFTTFDLNAGLTAFVDDS
jgi:hypothetical protein